MHTARRESFVAHADEKVTAFSELELTSRMASNWLDELAAFFAKDG
jgi:hypothetical protein